MQQKAKNGQEFYADTFLISAIKVDFGTPKEPGNFKEIWDF
jgi:hypothetical protein